MSKTPAELRTDFWQADFNRGGVIRTQYEDIKRVLERCDMQWV